MGHETKYNLNPCGKPFETRSCWQKISSDSPLASNFSTSAAHASALSRRRFIVCIASLQLWLTWSGIVRARGWDLKDASGLTLTALLVLVEPLRDHLNDDCWSSVELISYS
jgi:hypothetical protein